MFDELRKLATAKLAKEKPGQTLQATQIPDRSAGSSVSANNSASGFAPVLQIPRLAVCLIRHAVPPYGLVPFPENLRERLAALPYVRQVVIQSYSATS